MLLQDFLKLDTKRRIKLVRHQDSRFDLRMYYQRGWLDYYQAWQGRPVFDAVDLIVSFLGDRGARSLLLGAYEVGGRCAPGPPPEGWPAAEHDDPNDGVFYALKRLPTEFDGRLVIDWGKATRSWVQNYNPKEILELLPAGYVAEFPGFMEFVLSFRDLTQIVKNPDANREWHRLLASVAGVYLMVDTATGAQYVGSAYGKDGIIGRWKSYVATGHAGNDQLKTLLATAPGAQHRFLFSVLQTLPQSKSSRSSNAGSVSSDRGHTGLIAIKAP